MQGSDMVLALARPYKAEIPLYGPKEYAAGPEDIFGHVIKSRNGQDDDNMFFLKADFPKQVIHQVVEPQGNNPTGTFLPRRARRTAGNANSFPDPNLNI